MGDASAVGEHLTAQSITSDTNTALPINQPSPSPLRPDQTLQNGQQFSVAPPPIACGTTSSIVNTPASALQPAVQATSTAQGSAPIPGTPQLTVVSNAQQATPNGSAITNNSATPLMHNPKEWKSCWLEPPILLSLVSVTLVMIGSLIGLSIWSTTHHGLASLDLTKEYMLFNIPDLGMGISLAWTFVPVLIIQLYVLTISAVVNAASSRQPYIELRKHGSNGRGAATEKSISLDYHSYWAVWAPLKALQYNHFMLTYSFSIMLVVNVILTALTSHLFYTNIMAVTEEIQADQTVDIGFWSIGSPLHLTPVLDTVAATRLYDGQPPSWTTLDQSIVPFDLDGLAHAVNVTAIAAAYAASLECYILDKAYEFNLAETNLGFFFNAVDRGCEMTNQVFLNVNSAEYNTTYIHTTPVNWCGRQAGFTRILLVAASNLTDVDEDRKFTNTVALSCTTAYYNQTGHLKISIDSRSSQAPTIIDYVVHGEQVDTLRPPYAWAFENGINGFTVVDNDAAVEASYFGRLIYDYTRKMSPESYMDAEIFRTATMRIFRTAYAVAVNRLLLQPTELSQLDATVYTNDTRLVVVLPVACIVISMLTAVVAMLVWILIYSNSHQSILYEEPVGLLGAAAILRNSNLIDRVEGLPANTCEGRVAAEYIRQNKAQTAVREGWRLENWHNAGLAALEPTPKARPFGYREIFRR